MNRRVVLLIAVVLLAVGSASASTITVLVGDKDGYGLATPCPDNGTCIWDGAGASGTNMDHRSASEVAATNGAQITDVYSSIFPGSGPNTSTMADVRFPFSGTLTSASLTIAMGDFQCNQFGTILASINGVSMPFCFQDGFQVTKTRSFALSASELAAANLAGMVDLHLDHNNSGDFIAFDWFQLDGTAVPEPSSLLLLGTGLVGLATWGRKKFFTTIA